MKLVLWKAKGVKNEKIFVNYFYIEYSRRFLSQEKHPRFNQPYFQLFYLPMIELIDYLTDHGFRVYIVSTSQQEFIRSVSKEILNIPKNQIIGTMVGFSLMR